MKQRVLRVFEKIHPTPDALVLQNSVEPHLDQSFFYLFDSPSGLFEGSIQVAHPDGTIDLLTSPLEEESARQAAQHDPSVRVQVATGRDGALKATASLVGGTGRLALNFHELTHELFLGIEKQFPKAKFVDASAALRDSRVIKDATEIERLGTAAKIGSKVAREIPGLLKAGITELDLAADIEYAMGRQGAEGRSFATIVGFGPNSAEPHYSPGTRRLAPGDSIVCDFGALHKRYASDITRSFRFGPRDEELKKVHETVEAAQQAALAVLRAGAKAKDVHRAAEEVVDRSPWKGRFTHGLGHSVGLAVHDGFSMNATVDEPLQAGMVLTVEPGIYLPGKGGVRIEDDVVVTKTGYTFLTDAPREYIEVGA